MKKEGKKLDSHTAFDAMARALAAYIESMGGKAVVVGGVSVGKMAGSLDYNYFVQINVTGKMPNKKP